MSQVVRIANCSGYYGDRLDAARQLVEGGPIDVLTGDYLAELTMSILFDQKKARGEKMGYVGTFLKQLEDVAAICLERGVKIVVNAGGLNPRSLADEVETLLRRLGLTAKVAWIDGDDILPDLASLQDAGEDFLNLDTGERLDVAGRPPLTANVYLGAWGIKEALDQGADIVLCPRVTDAALVIGPAAWKFGWKRDDYDALAGALAAGHVIECGAQCCGGNYSFFQEVPSFRNVGYPIAEIEADGSFTITKHPGTGGLVSVGTVTAQLLYEISSPAYVNPDVIAHFDTLSIVQEGPDRVRVSGCRGSSPPPTHKVCFNTPGPWKQSFEVCLTGLDIGKKAEIYLDQLLDNFGGRERFDDVDVQLIRSDKSDAASNEEAHAVLRVTLTSRDPSRLGRLLSAKAVEIGLATIPGNVGRGGGGFSGGQTIVHWPALIDSRRVVERVHVSGIDVIEVMPTQRLDLPDVGVQVPPQVPMRAPAGPVASVPFGRLFGTRSGDKGGHANCGVWAKTDEGYAFLRDFLTVDAFRRLCPDMAAYDIDRYEMPNLRALNFLVRGVLAGGASSNNRLDRQAKSLGEYLGTRMIEVPVSLVPSSATV
ncbi:MAG: acyclic terpene utilization AtuA family protein [Alphaproteobacteria bacterium]|nr:acyclic terpene utilization AtuA family protein [Alphaproteobacteria bacterium]